MSVARPLLVVMAFAVVGVPLGCSDEDETVYRPAVSPDGESVVTVEESGGKQKVVHDAKEAGGAYDRVFPPVVSPDGESVAFVAQSGDRYTLVKDGEPVGEPKELVLYPTYGPDGESFAYVVSGDEGDQTLRVMRDGKQVGGTYRDVRPPAFGPDGKSIAFAADVEGKLRVVRDGEPTGSGYDEIHQLRITPARSTVHIAVDSTTGEEWLVRDGRPASDKYDRIWGWAASPDGASLAWIARRDGREVLVKDGAEVGEPFSANAVAGPVFAPDGETVGFAAGHGTWTLRKDGAPLGPEFEAGGVRHLLFSPDGRSLACSVVDGPSEFVVKNGVRVGGTYRAVSRLQNSPDGQHVQFYGLVGKRRQLVRIPWSD